MAAGFGFIDLILQIQSETRTSAGHHKLSISLSAP